MILEREKVRARSSEGERVREREKDREREREKTGEKEREIVTKQNDHDGRVQRANTAHAFAEYFE